MTLRHDTHIDGVHIKDIILGGQDGLVNVLGLVLGVAAATHDVRLVIISGLAGTFAESISMAAVAYTSAKAARDFYFGELAREESEIETIPHIEKKEIEDIYKKKGFRGTLLKQVVNKITSRREVWLLTMMSEELRMFPDDYMNPASDAMIVGFSSLIGSLVPLVAFFYVNNVGVGIVLSVIISAIALFVTGALKAKYTIGDWKKSGIEMMLIGLASALIGYGIGRILGVAF